MEFVMEAVKIMEDVGVRIQFQEDSILIDAEVTEGGWKPAWRPGMEEFAGETEKKE